MHPAPAAGRAPRAEHRSRGARRPVRRDRGRGRCARSTAARTPGWRARAPRRFPLSPRRAAAARCPGPTKKRPSLSLKAMGRRDTADTRVDDREMHADGHVRQRAREHERALQNRLRRNPVGNVDHPCVRRNPRDDAVTRADEVVLQPEVAEKADDHQLVALRTARHSGTSPWTSCVPLPRARRPRRRGRRGSSRGRSTLWGCPYRALRRPALRTARRAPTRSPSRCVRRGRARGFDRGQ